MFSFGGSKSKNSSQSSSLDYGANVSQSFSDSLSRAVSGGQSTSGSRVAFEDIFRDLYGSATGAAGRAAEMTPLLQGQAASLFSSGSQFLEQLAGGAERDYLRDRVSGDNPLVDEQIGALGEDLGRFFREQINPEIAMKGIAGGTLGGGRQGVAQGMAADSLAREFQRGATEIRAQDMGMRDAAARDLAGIEMQSAGSGLASLGSMLNLSETAATADLAPFAALSQILGGPTVLSESQSTQFSESEAIARAISEALGFSFGESSSSSKGSSKSMNVGFG